MSKPVTLQKDFSRGMKRDYPRNAMPAGSFWGGSDWIPLLLATIRERGGYTYASGDISAAKATAASVRAGIYAPFAAGPYLVVVDEDGEAYKVTTGGVASDIAAAVTTVQNPVFHRTMVIIPAAGGSTAPKKVTDAGGTPTVAALGGSPPNGQYAAVWGDYSLLANTSAQPTGLYFSAPGDPETWDTTNSLILFAQPITGLAAVRNFILIFHEGYISRLYGSTPPPGTDLQKSEPLFDVGTPDARSIGSDGDKICFANGEGIYYTDGSAEPADITSRCGMKTYWREQLASYAKSTWTLAGGFYGGYYFITVLDNTGAVKLGAFVDIDRAAWWPLTNIDAACWFAAQGTTDKLYFGRRGAARVGEISSIFMPSATVKNDGDGTAVTSVLETPYYEGEFGKKRFRQLYVDFELKDWAADDPTAALSYITTPEATSYTTLSTSLAESTTKTTTRALLGFGADGIAFKIARAHAGDFKLYGVEADVYAEEASKRAA